MVASSSVAMASLVATQITRHAKEGVDSTTSTKFEKQAVPDKIVRVRRAREQRRIEIHWVQDASIGVRRERMVRLVAVGEFVPPSSSRDHAPLALWLQLQRRLVPSSRYVDALRPHG